MQRVHALKEARAALAAGASELHSEPFAACHAGVNYHRAMVDQLRAEFPQLAFTYTLCCGEDAAIAHEALRAGFDRVQCMCDPVAFVELEAMAESLGATVLRLDPSFKDAKPN